ncbi:hypothetical protein HK101_003814 [Irineochytrium annulatum]|nr:hypothetical protein HK101_003814 [Irineochytrium annulatum]
MLLKTILSMVAATAALASGAIAAYAGRNYDAHKVFRFNVQTEEQLALVKAALSNYDKDLSLFSHTAKLGTVDVRMSPTAIEAFKGSVLANIPNSVHMDDLGANIKAEREYMQTHSLALTEGLKSGAIKAVTASTVFSDYQDLSTYVTFMQSLPGVSQVSIGKTYLGADIPGFVFGTGPAHVVIHGGIHAREWIAPSVAVYIANYLTTDSSAATLLTQFTFTVIPVMNPDGYAYTRASNGDRMHRKNMQPNKGSSCVGTDNNRNFNDHWSSPGASSDPCADNYYGAAPNTVETLAISNYLKAVKAYGYFDFHSYSQLWMFPEGWSCSSKAADYTTLMKGSQLAVDALQAVHGISFQNGDICNTIYQASGSSSDYAYNVAGVKFPYAIELRDTGSNGFTLPASQIVPSGQEVAAAMKAVLTYMYSQYSGGSTTTTKTTSTSTTTKTTTTSTATTSTCAHNKCSTGTKLVASCDPCVNKIIAQDSYCGSTKWDSQCVSEVNSICGITC